MRLLAFFVLLFLGGGAFSQITENQPKLVVGIVVDQLRAEQLHRYENHFGPNGFNRLRKGGFYAANHHFSYVPTYTAPGHASIYTGTTPSVHGIVSNSWYDSRLKRTVYCVEDQNVEPLGVTGNEGLMSPRNLKTTGLADELKMFWNERSKVVGVSIKDRGAILPAGHMADGAFWLSQELDFISSSWYFDSLPDWVTRFNALNRGDELLDQPWELLLPESEYNASLPDDNPYETLSKGEGAPVMPKDLNLFAAEQGKHYTLANSPHGNTLVLEFAKAAIENEELGEDDVPDLLSISFSSTDYVGHSYGPRSVEIQDVYLRLDRELGEFMDYLDKRIGLENCLIFLTSDHGGAENAVYGSDRGMPAGLFSRTTMIDTLQARFPRWDLDRFIEKHWGNNITLNRVALEEEGMDPVNFARKLGAAITSIEGVYSAYVTSDLMRSGATNFPVDFVRRGLYPSLAPDITWVLESGWMRYIKTGTTHGSPFSYDTHVPFIVYGKGVSPGVTYRKTYIRDIAPTVSALLGISFPSGTTGRPIEESIAY